MANENLTLLRPAAWAYCLIRPIFSCASSGDTLTPNQPSPISATRLSAGVLSPPNTIGGYGFCTGLGYIRTLGKLQNSPLNSDSSSVHKIFIAFKYSRVRSPRRAHGT